MSKNQDIELEKNYTFNAKTRKYIVKLKGSEKNVVISESKHKAMIRAYSDFYGTEKTLNEISLEFNFPRPLLDQYFKVFGISHASLPLTDEDLEENPDILVDDLLLQKRFEISQKFEKKDWRETQEQAKKWLEFKEGIYDPFDSCLKGWKPPIYKVYKPIDKKGNLSLIVVLSDLHYGAHANKNDLVRGENTNTSSTVAAVQSYYKKILDDIKNYKFNIDNITILSLGDILHTANPFGTTTKGTPLTYDLLNEAQFDAAFNSLNEFIHQLSKVVPKTTIHSLKGNHFGVGDNILFKCLAAYFKDQKNIEFNIHHKYATCFRERNLFCVATHGASNSYKAKYSGTKVQSFVQSLIINNELNMEGIKARAAFFADLHHSQTKEFSDFNYILCPSIVRGDNYADALGLYSKAAQQAFLIDDIGIKMTLNYNF